MGTTEKRREQNRQAQAKHREKRNDEIQKVETCLRLERGLCAALRSAVRNGRKEFEHLLSADDSKTVENLADYFARIDADGHFVRVHPKRKKVAA